MASDVIIPRIGWSMEKGVFVEWLKKEGDAIAVGDALFLIEADKANAEIVSEEAGILHIFPGRAKQGDELMVGTVIGCLLDADESLPGDIVPAGAAPTEVPAGDELSASPKEMPVMPFGQSPRHGSRIISSPRARRVSRESGVDLIGLAGSGRGGRIVERDVRTAVTERERRKASAHLAEWPLIPSTIRLTADTTQLVSLLARLGNSGADTRLAPVRYRGLLVKLAVSAYQHAFDTANSAAGYDIAYGSLVDERIAWSCLRGARRKGLDELSLELDSVEGKAGGISGQESFAFVDLGAFGIDEYIPGVDIPSNLLLCFGRLVEGKAQEGMQSRTQTLKIGLSFKENLVSFAQASRFLRNLGSALLDPVLWLL